MFRTHTAIFSRFETLHRTVARLLRVLILRKNMRLFLSKNAQTARGRLGQSVARCSLSTKPLATPASITAAVAAPLQAPQAPSSSSAAAKIPPQNSGRSIVRHPYSLTDEPIPSTPSSAQDMFAVVSFSGTQYKVVLDDLLVADRIEGVDIGDKLSLDVLLVASRKGTVVGRPLVEGAKVLCEVEEIAKDKKVVTLKTRRRKNSKSLVGFRRQVTILRVLDIAVSPADLEAL